MIDEMLFSGFLRKRPLRIVKSVTNDIYVPANAEFVLEGYVDLDERRLEGPFGDHTGYYSLADDYPVFHVETITRKKKPVYPATIVGKPPMEDCYMAKATERIFLPLMRLFVPEIIDMNLPLEGVFHNCCIVSIEKKFPKHAHKVMHALWGLGQMMYTKMIIVVDHTVDVQDLSTVMWKVFNNIDPKRDLVITDGPLDALDHSSPTAFHGGRLGIDATKKSAAEGHPREWPDDIIMSQDIVETVTRKWADYGLDD
jgi:4-hydroxy-3-polyprenylbenzoate decarboxylase